MVSVARTCTSLLPEEPRYIHYTEQPKCSPEFRLRMPCDESDIGTNNQC